MIQLQNIFNYIQNNWPAIIILFASLLWVITIYANLKVEWAKTTPEKTDDEEAKLFKTRTQIITNAVKKFFTGFGSFLASFTKKKKEKGFLELKSALYLILFLIGLVLGAFLAKKLIKPEVKEVPIEKLVYVEIEKKQEAIKKVTQVKTNKDGSSETKIVEESQSQSESLSAGKIENKSNKDLLGISATFMANKNFDLGLKILDGEIPFIKKKFEVDAVGQLKNIEDFKQEKSIGIRLRL